MYCYFLNHTTTTGAETKKILRYASRGLTLLYMQGTQITVNPRAVSARSNTFRSAIAFSPRAAYAVTSTHFAIYVFRFMNLSVTYLEHRMTGWR
jgi:hypothetical protein